MRIRAANEQEERSDRDLGQVDLDLHSGPDGIGSDRLESARFGSLLSGMELNSWSCSA